jgi:hypothetical protein
MFEDLSDNIDDLLSLVNGIAGPTASGKLQFTEMSQYERGHLRSALLKSCELDTLAIVMIFEVWREWVK